MPKIKDKKNETGLIFCPTCKNGYLDGFNLRHINKVGECLKCDHVSAEVQDQQVADAKEAEDMFSRDLPF